MTVYLVGAGPGDPDLITRRGAAVLARADYVVVDRLVDRALLREAPPDAPVIDVGKSVGRGDPTVDQDDINALLVELGRTGATVVRLKGGDPFVFGRGGEEMVALRRAGIDVEVVPGVSSVFAAPALAGVPVTHRGVSSSVTVVSGHDPDAVDWSHLGPGDRTMVVVMGVEHRAEIARRLVDRGWSRATPVSVTQSASWDSHAQVHTTLDLLGACAAHPPAVIVIGHVAALGDRDDATAVAPANHAGVRAEVERSPALS